MFLNFFADILFYFIMRVGILESRYLDLNIVFFIVVEGFVEDFRFFCATFFVEMVFLVF